MTNGTRSHALGCEGFKAVSLLMVLTRSTAALATFLGYPRSLKNLIISVWVVSKLSVVLQIRLALNNWLYGMLLILKYPDI